MKYKACFLVGTLASSCAFAEINFNGFATIAGGMTTDENETIYGYDDALDFSNDSVMGLQANADLGDGLSFTAQFVSRGSEDWNTEAEWAYLSYEVNDNVEVLFGRQRVAFYKYSDFLDVGYAYHWIEPDPQAYGVPFDSTNGIGVRLSNQLGIFDSNIQFTYGRNREDLPLGVGEVPSDVQNLMAISWELTYDWLSFRLSAAQADVTVDLSSDPTLSQLIAAWESTPFSTVADDIALEDDKGQFAGAAISIDKNNFIFVGEITTVGSDDNILQDEDTSFYLSGGYRFGSFLVHANYALSENENELGVVSTVPDGASPELDTLKAQTIGAIQSQLSETEYYSVGLRWDFHPSAAFKTEILQRNGKLNEDVEGNADATLIRFAVSTVF